MVVDVKDNDPIKAILIFFQIIIHAQTPRFVPISFISPVSAVTWHTNTTLSITRDRLLTNQSWLLRMRTLLLLSPSSKLYRHWFCCYCSPWPWTSLCHLPRRALWRWELVCLTNQFVSAAPNQVLAYVVCKTKVTDGLLINGDGDFGGHGGSPA